MGLRFKAWLSVYIVFSTNRQTEDRTVQCTVGSFGGLSGDLKPTLSQEHSHLPRLQVLRFGKESNTGKKSSELHPVHIPIGRQILLHLIQVFRWPSVDKSAPCCTSLAGVLSLVCGAVVEGENLASKNCQLTATLAVMCAHVYTHTRTRIHTHKLIFKRLTRNSYNIKCVPLC